MPLPYENPFQSDQELAAKYAAERDASLDDSVFTGAVKSGLYGLASTGNAALAAGSRILGLNRLAANRERAADEWSAEAAGAGYKTPALKDVSGLGDAVDWGVGMVGSNLPLLASIVASGGAGGAAKAFSMGKKGLAKAAGRAAHAEAVSALGKTKEADLIANAAKALAEQSVDSKPHWKSALKYGLNRQLPETRIASTIGAVAPYFIESTGENYNAIRQDPETEGSDRSKALVSALTGAGQAALGTMFEPLHVMERFNKLTRAAQIAKAMKVAGPTVTPMQRLAAQAAGEGLTEAGEQLMQQAAGNVFNPNLGYDPAQLLEAGLGGALVGGVYASPGAIHAALQSGNVGQAAPAPEPMSDADLINLSNHAAAGDNPANAKKVYLALRDRLKVPFNVQSGGQVAAEELSVRAALLRAQTQLVDKFQDAIPPEWRNIPLTESIISTDKARSTKRGLTEEQLTKLVGLSPIDATPLSELPIEDRPAAAEKLADASGLTEILQGLYEVGRDPTEVSRALTRQGILSEDPMSSVLLTVADKKAKAALEEKAAAASYEQENWPDLPSIAAKLREASANEPWDDLTPEQLQELGDMWGGQEVDGSASFPEATGAARRPRVNDRNTLQVEVDPQTGVKRLKRGNHYEKVELRPSRPGEPARVLVNGDALLPEDAEQVRRLAQTASDETVFEEARKLFHDPTSLPKINTDEEPSIHIFDPESGAGILDAEADNGNPRFIVDHALDEMNPADYLEITDTASGDKIFVPRALEHYAKLHGGAMNIRVQRAGSNEQVDVPISGGVARILNKAYRLDKGMNPLAEHVEDEEVDGKKPTVGDFFKRVMDSYEFRHENKTGKSFVSHFRAVRDPVTHRIVDFEHTFAPNTHDTGRVSPLQKRYDVSTVKISTDGPAYLFQRAFDQAIDAMAQQRKVFVGGMDNKLFFMSPDNRKRFIQDTGTQSKLEADANLTERYGVLLKKESGDSNTYNVGHIAKRHQIETTDANGNKVVSNPNDGTMGIVKGAKLVQGVAERDITGLDPDDPNRKYEFDKGIWRSPIQRLTAWMVGKDGRIDTSHAAIQAEEEESLNNTMQLKFSRAERAPGSADMVVVHGMFPPAAQRGGSANFQQVTFAALADQVIRFLKAERLAKFAGKRAQELLSPVAQRLIQYGVPPSVVETPTRLLKWLTKYEATTARAYTMASADMLDTKYSPLSAEKIQELSKIFKEEYNGRTYIPGKSDLLLMPETYNDLNKAWRRRTGKDLQIGDVVILHRDPALPDSSSMAPFVFTGIAQLETSEGSHNRGITVHPEAEGWADAAGDFDGDSGVVMFPDKDLIPRSPRKTGIKFVKPGGLANEPIGQFLAARRADTSTPADDGTHDPNVPLLDRTVKTYVDDPTRTPHPEYNTRRNPKNYDLLAFLGRERANGFNQMIGRIIKQAQRLAEIGELDTPYEFMVPDKSGNFIMQRVTYGDAIAIIGQASISAKKKATYAEEAMREVDRIARNVRDMRPQHMDPDTGNYTEEQDDYYVDLFGNIEKAPEHGSGGHRRAIARAREEGRDTRLTSKLELMRQVERLSAEKKAVHQNKLISRLAVLLIPSPLYNKIIEQIPGWEAFKAENVKRKRAEMTVLAGRAVSDEAVLSALARDVEIPEGATYKDSNGVEHNVLRKIASLMHIAPEHVNNPLYKEAFFSRTLLTKAQLNRLEPQLRGAVETIQNGIDANTTWDTKYKEFKANDNDPRFLRFLRSIMHDTENRFIYSQPVITALEDVVPGVDKTIHTELAFRAADMARAFNELGLLQGNKLDPLTRKSAKELATKDAEDKGISYDIMKARETYLRRVTAANAYYAEQLSKYDSEDPEVEGIKKKQADIYAQVEFFLNTGIISPELLIAYGPDRMAARLVDNESVWKRIRDNASTQESVEEYVKLKDKNGSPINPRDFVSGVYAVNPRTGAYILESPEVPGEGSDLIGKLTLTLAPYDNYHPGAREILSPLTRIANVASGGKVVITVEPNTKPTQDNKLKVTIHNISMKDAVYGERNDPINDKMTKLVAKFNVAPGDRALAGGSPIDTAVIRDALSKIKDAALKGKDPRSEDEKEYGAMTGRMQLMYRNDKRKDVPENLWIRKEGEKDKVPPRVAGKVRPVSKLDKDTIAVTKVIDKNQVYYVLITEYAPDQRNPATRAAPWGYVIGSGNEKAAREEAYNWLKAHIPAAVSEAAAATTFDHTKPLTGQIDEVLRGAAAEENRDRISRLAGFIDAAGELVEARTAALNAALNNGSTLQDMLKSTRQKIAERRAKLAAGEAQANNKALINSLAALYSNILNEVGARRMKLKAHADAILAKREGLKKAAEALGGKNLDAFEAAAKAEANGPALTALDPPINNEAAPNIAGNAGENDEKAQNARGFRQDPAAARDFPQGESQQHKVLRTLRRNMKPERRAALENMTNSIGLRLGLKGQARLVSPEYMYDLLKASGNQHNSALADKILAYAEGREGGVRGVHLQSDDGTHFIWVAAGKNNTEAEQLGVLAHEIGHWVLDSEIKDLQASGNAKLLAQMEQEFKTWLGPRTRKTDRLLKEDTKYDKFTLHGAVLDSKLFHEWVADNVAAWLIKDEEGIMQEVTGGTKGWFATVAQKFREAYHSLMDVIGGAFFSTKNEGEWGATESVAEWMKKIADRNADIVTAFGPFAGTTQTLADRVVLKTAALKEWAKNPNGPMPFRYLNDIAGYVANHLDQILTPRDAMMLRRIATEPDMMKRMYELMHTDTEGANKMWANSDQAAAYMYILAKNGILKPPSDRTGGLFDRITQYFQQYVRMLNEATPEEVKAVLGALNQLDGPMLQEPRDLLQPGSPAARLYQDAQKNFAKGLFGSWQRATKEYSNATGWYLDVPYQQALQTRIPVFKDFVEKIQPMAWQLAGLQRSGMIENQKIRFELFAQQAAKMLGGLNAAETMEFFRHVNTPGSKAQLSTKVAEADEVRKQLMEAIYRYITEDPKVAAAIGMGHTADYWPMIPDLDRIRDNIDAVASTFSGEGASPTVRKQLHQEWEGVLDEYVRWIKKNMDPGPGAHPDLSRAVQAEVERINRMSEVAQLDDNGQVVDGKNGRGDIKEFVKEYFTKDEDRLLPGWRLKQLQAGKPSTPGFRFKNPRLLNFLLRTGHGPTHDFVLEYLEQDLTRVMTRYIKNVSKRVEFARLQTAFSENGFEDLWAKGRAQGATNKDIAKIVEYIDAINGMLGLQERDWLDEKIAARGPDSMFARFHSGGKNIMNEDLNAIRSWAHTFVNFAHLTLNAATSVADPFGILLRGESGKLFWSAIQQTKDMADRVAKDMPLSEKQRFVELIGAAQRAFVNMDLQESYQGIDQTPSAQKAGNFLFKWNGVEWMSTKGAIMATLAGQEYIKQEYERAQSEDTNEKFKGVQNLARLGLTVEDIVTTGTEENAVKILSWEERMEIEDKIIALEKEFEALGRPVDREAEYRAARDKERFKLDSDIRRRVAVLRFVEQSQVRPGPALRSMFMSNPYYSLIGIWRPFISAYDNMIMKPVWMKLTQDGNATPLMWWALTMIPVLIFGEIMRDAIKMSLSDDRDEYGEKVWTPPYKRGWTLSDYVTQAIAKGGLYGKNEVVMDIAAPLLDNDPAKAVAQAGGVLTSDMLKAYRWGRIPAPFQDLTRNWGGAEKKEETRQEDMFDFIPEHVW